jgi:hypothetical protein
MADVMAAQIAGCMAAQIDGLWVGSSNYPNGSMLSWTRLTSHNKQNLEKTDQRAR